MKMKRTLKRLAAVLMLAAGIMAVSAPSSADEVVRVLGPGNEILASHPATAVAYLEFAEGPESIEIPLSENVKFTMIKVEGGVPYTLKNGSITWTEGKTAQIEDFWIGKFEVTQGLWKEVMGITNDDDLPVSNNTYNLKDLSLPVGSKQSAFGDSYPIANVSWNDVMGENGFLSKINERLNELKDTYPALKTALGEKEFRLPSEWEWEYAAAGGKKNATLDYYYSGTKTNTVEALQQVAVNNCPPNQATSVAVVGSKLPNELGLYDMSGNVVEFCSGLGYPNHSEPGFLTSNNVWEEPNIPLRGGSWCHSEAATYFKLNSRLSGGVEWRYPNRGFRLAL